MTKTITNALQQVSSNKFSQIPESLNHEVERIELIEKLNSDVKLIVLEAPAGYGKTTCLAQWVRKGIDSNSTRSNSFKTTKVVWLSLSSDDCAPEALTRSILNAALKQVNGLDRFETTYLDNSQTQNPLFSDTSSVSVLSRIVADLFNHSEDDLVLILDNGDTLEKDTCEWINHFVMQLRDGHKVVFSHRGTASIAISRLSGAGLATIISEEDLRFSQTETKLLLEKFNIDHSGINKEYIDTLEGWAIALVLTCMHEDLKGLQPERLIEEILSDLPKTLIYKLIQSSILPQWIEDDLKDIGIDICSTDLLYAYRLGAPIHKSGKNSYHPHSLLHNVLKSRLERDKKLYKNLSRKVAVFFKQKDEHLKAYTHYLNSEDYKQAAELILPYCKNWEKHHRWSVVLHYLEQLPTEHFFTSQATIELVDVLARAYIETQNFSKAEDLLIEAAKHNCLTGKSYFCLARLCIKKQDFEEYESLLKIGLKNENTPLETLLLVYAQAVLEFNRGNQKDAKAKLEPYQNMLQALPDSEDKFIILSLWYTTCITVGEFDFKNLELETLVDSIQEKGFKNANSMYSALFFYLQATSQFNKLIDTTTKIIPTWEQQELLHGLSHAYYARADAHMALHNFGVASSDYQASRNATEAYGFPGLPEAEFGLLHSLFHAGNFKAHDKRLSKVSLEDIPPHKYFDYYCLMGLTAYQNNDFSTATKKLKKATSYDDGVNPQIVVPYLYLADIKHQSDELVKEDCDSIFKHQWRSGFDMHMAIEANKLSKLLQTFYDKNWHKGKLEKYIQQSKQLKSGFENSKTVLSIKTLGPVEVSLLRHTNQSDEVLPISYAKLKELFVYLALNPTVHRDEIHEAIWPEQQLSSVYSAVTRFRNLISPFVKENQKVLIKKGEYYHLSQNIELQLDIHQLEVLLDNDPTKAFQLYQDEFMKGINSEWILPLREHYKQLVSTKAYNIGKSLEISEANKALTWYQKALVFNPESVETLEDLQSLAKTLNQQELVDKTYLILNALEQGIVSPISFK